MPGPRADFACSKCGVTHEDLPIESLRCPVTGFKRGFRRLYNGVNVSGSQQHAAAGIVDRVVAPEYNRQQQIKSAAIQAQVPTQYVPPAALLNAAKGLPNAPFSMPVLGGLRGKGPRWVPP